MDEVLAARRAARASRSQGRVNVVAVFILLISVIIGVVMTAGSQNPGWLLTWVVVGFVFAQSPKIAKQWERGIVLRLGRYTGLKGPGLFWITPFIETVSIYIDQRVVTTSFAAEETLTSDTVPVNVDAVLFWMVHDSEKAALEVQDYAQAVSWAAQTGRPLSSSEEYAVAKMRLFNAFDEGVVKASPQGEPPREVIVNEANLEELLGQLGI
jgi:hypothetical protein